jgi:hypothetical protein
VRLAAAHRDIAVGARAKGSRCQLWTWASTAGRSHPPTGRRALESRQSPPA